jgi:hypothetical protein
MTNPTSDAPPAQPAGISAADAVARLEAVRGALAAIRPRIDSREPWPLAASFGTGPEASWGPREVLAHAAEMLPFWLGEFERIVDGGRGAEDPLPFGRTGEDILRVGVLERDRTLPLRELWGRIDTGIARWVDRVGSGSADEGASIGLHSRLGPMSADRARDRFVVEHLEEHLSQLEDILAR